MSYQRFVLPRRAAARVRPATGATPATHEPPAAPTVAELAIVAGQRPGSEVDGNEAAQHRDWARHPATIATTATVGADQGRSVAVVASVAGFEPGPQAYDEVEPSRDWPREAATLATSATGAVPIGELGPLYPPAGRQDPTRCLVCEERFTADDVVVAVLSGTPDQPHWLHHRCHDAHIQRCLAARQRVAAPASGRPQ